VVRIGLDLGSGVPVYRQIIDQVLGGIASGALNPGEQLPTVRQLAVDLRVNANTVAKVYAELERAGLLATQRGIGTFVRAVPTPPAGSTRRDRERELKPLVERLLADASAIGISLHDVVQYVKTLESRNTKEST